MRPAQHGECSSPSNARHSGFYIEGIRRHCNSCCFRIRQQHSRPFNTFFEACFAVEKNNFLLPALTITQLYRARWKVELFFRWIKQHLHIKAFYGTSENAVKTQVWVALSVYVLVAIVKKQLGLELSLYKILQILSVTIFEKTPILEGFSNFSDEFPTVEQCIQLSLFDLQ